MSFNEMNTIENALHVHFFEKTIYNQTLIGRLANYWINIPNYGRLYYGI